MRPVCPFYVYEHWRPDRDECFYVGKGKGQRAFTKHGRARNKQYARIVKKLARLGMCIEIRMVQSGLSETEAFALEIERIAFWRGAGINLANMTDGGEGAAGIKYSAARRAAIAASSRGRKHSAQTRALMSKLAMGRGAVPGEVRAVLSQKSRSLWEKPEYRKKVSAAHSERSPIAESTRLKMSTAQKSRAPRSEETRAKTSASIKAWHARRKAELEGAR